MAEGRGSAVLAAILLLCLVLVHQTEVAQAAIYTVGGNSGWNFNVAAWTKGKRFKAGDTLVFNYGRGVHSVVAVNKAGYNSCRAPKGAKSYASGKDRIMLLKGQNYFICGVPGHCRAGMKIAINAV